jgi:predicted nuclease with TOPRIM domain
VEVSTVDFVDFISKIGEPGVGLVALAALIYMFIQMMTLFKESTEVQQKERQSLIDMLRETTPLLSEIQATVQQIDSGLQQQIVEYSRRFEEQHGDMKKQIEKLREDIQRLEVILTRIAEMQRKL